MRITSNVKIIYISISRAFHEYTSQHGFVFNYGTVWQYYIIRMLKHFQGPQTCVWPQRFYDVDYVWGVVKRKSVFRCMCIHICFFCVCTGTCISDMLWHLWRVHKNLSFHSHRVFLHGFGSRWIETCNISGSHQAQRSARVMRIARSSRSAITKWVWNLGAALGWQHQFLHVSLFTPLSWALPRCSPMCLLFLLHAGTGFIITMPKKSQYQMRRLDL